MAIVHEGSAPYAPASQVLTAIRHYREKGAQQFSKELLMKLGMPTAYANRTLNALRLLDLVDEDGAPTEAFTEIQRAGADEYKARFEQVIRTAYSEVFQVVDPATASEQAIHDAFRFYEPRAQRGKMVTLFLALCEEAGIIGAEKAPRKRMRAGRSETPRKTTAGSSGPGRSNGTDGPGGHEDETPPIDPPKPISHSSSLMDRYIEVLIEKAAASDDDNLLDRIEGLLRDRETKD